MQRTRRFMNLDKLNLVMVVWFQAQANVCYFPRCIVPQGISKAVKIDTKIITLQCIPWLSLNLCQCVYRTQTC